MASFRKRLRDHACLVVVLAGALYEGYQRGRSKPLPFCYPTVLMLGALTPGVVGWWNAGRLSIVLRDVAKGST